MKTLFVVVVVLAVVVPMQAQTEATEKDREALISLEFKDAPLQSTLDALFRGTDKSFVMDYNVDKKKIIPNLSLKSVTFDGALKTITRAAGVTYRRDFGGVHSIVSKATPVTAPIPYVPETPPEDNVEVTERRVHRVPLHYVDAYDIAAMFGAQGFTSRGSALAFGGNNGGMAGMGGFVSGGMPGIGGMGYPQNYQQNYQQNIYGYQPGNGYYKNRPVYNSQKAAPMVGF